MAGSPGSSASARVRARSASSQRAVARRGAGRCRARQRARRGACASASRRLATVPAVSPTSARTARQQACAWKEVGSSARRGLEVRGRPSSNAPEPEVGVAELQLEGGEGARQPGAQGEECVARRLEAARLRLVACAPRRPPRWRRSRRGRRRGSAWRGFYPLDNVIIRSYSFAHAASSFPKSRPRPARRGARALPSARLRRPDGARGRRRRGREPRHVPLPLQEPRGVPARAAAVGLRGHVRRSSPSARRTRRSRPRRAVDRLLRGALRFMGRFVRANRPILARVLIDALVRATRSPSSSSRTTLRATWASCWA